MKIKPGLKNKAKSSTDQELRKAIDRFKLEMLMAVEEANNMGRVIKESSTMLVYLWSSLCILGENRKDLIA